MGNQNSMFKVFNHFTPSKTIQPFDGMKKDCQQLMEMLTADMSFNREKEEQAAFEVKLKLFQEKVREEFIAYIAKHKRIMYSVVSAWVNQKALEEGNSFESISSNLESLYSSLKGEIQDAVELRRSSEKQLHDAEEVLHTEKAFVVARMSIVEGLLGSIVQSTSNKGSDEKAATVTIDSDIIKKFFTKMDTATSEDFDSHKLRLAQQKAFA